MNNYTSMFINRFLKILWNLLLGNEVYLKKGFLKSPKLFDSETIHYVIYKQYIRLIVGGNPETKYIIFTNRFEFNYTVKDFAVRIQVQNW